MPVYSLLCSCLAVSDASDAQPYGVLLTRHMIMHAWKHVCLGLGMSTHEQRCSRFNLLGSQASALALHGPTLALQHSKAQYNTAHAGRQAHSARRSTDSDEGLRLFPLHQRHSHRRTAKHTMQSKEAKEYAEGWGGEEVTRTLLTPPRPSMAAATSLWIGSVQPSDTTRNLPSPPFFVQTPQLSSITSDFLPCAAVVALTAPATVCRNTMSPSVLRCQCIPPMRTQQWESIC